MLEPEELKRVIGLAPVLSKMLAIPLICFVTFISLLLILKCVTDNIANYNYDDTLDPESYRNREVYAFYGLTMYHIQCLERTLAMLATTVYNPNADHITKLQFDSILEGNFKKTLGRLISTVKKSVDLSDDFEKKLSDALEKRNFIAHRYFFARAMKFGHIRGQKEMIAELSRLSVYFQNVDNELDLILRKWMNAKGITDNTIYQIMGDSLLSEIKDINDDGEAVKQVMGIVLNQILNDASSKDRYNAG